MNIPRRASVSTVAVAALAGLAGACGGDDAPTFSIRIHAPPPITADGLCPPAGNFVPLTLGTGDSIRVTYRDPASHSILCDAVLPFDQPTARLGVPRSSGDAGTGPPRADIIVETFHTDEAMLVTLTGSGETEDVNLGGTAEVPVFVAPRQNFACTAGPQQVARAFHSATVLPNGEVLLVGGLVSHPGPNAIPLTAPTGNFYVSETAEIYDPRRGTFRELPVVDLLPRVFHAAYLLTPTEDSPSTWDILLVGGLTVTGPSSSTPVVDGVRDAVEPLRLVPAPGSEPAGPEILTYDPATGTATKRQLADDTMFGRRAFPGTSPAPSPWDKVIQAPPIVAGGWSAYSAGTITGSNSLEVVDLSTGARIGTMPAAFTPDISRGGATATLLAGGRALIWGGNLQSVAGAEGTETGHVVTGIGSGSPTIAAITFDPMLVNPHPRAFHSAVALGPDRVLVVGGFRVQAGTAFEPNAPFAYTVNVDPMGPAITTTTITATEGVPAGYMQAIPILGGDILITGGSPEMAMYICPDSVDPTYLCSIPRAYLFRSATEVIDKITDMVVPRWGHRTVSLADGTVLITGGLRLDLDLLNTILAVGDAELWNPRTETLDPAADDPAILAGTITRVPGQVAKNMDGTDARPCFVGSP